MSKKPPAPQHCCCGSHLNASSCCVPFLDGTRIPESAEQLMRSRYSAYVLQRKDYLMGTWHESTRPENITDDDGPGIKWLALEVHQHICEGSTATVSFTAACKVSGRLTRMHECSRFVHEGGRWWYVDGQIDG